MNTVLFRTGIHLEALKANPEVRRAALSTPQDKVNLKGSTSPEGNTTPLL